MSIFIFRHYDFMFCLFGHKIIVFGTMFLFGKKILLVALLIHITRIFFFITFIRLV